MRGHKERERERSPFQDSLGDSFSPLRLYRQSHLFFSWQCNISVAQGIRLVNIYLSQLNYHFGIDAVTVYTYFLLLQLTCTKRI